MSAPIEALLSAHLLAAPAVEEDFPFWYKLAYSADEPVLIAGPGAARLAQPLARYGIRTVAHLAPGEAEPAADPDSPLTCVRGDLGEAAAHCPFGLIVANSGTLATAGDPRTQVETLHRLLRLGGRLALALPFPDLARLAEAAAPGGSPLRAVARQPGSEASHHLFLWEQWHYEPHAQRLTRHLIAETVNEAGESSGRWHRRAAQAILWPGEMALLLEVVGFRAESHHGGYRGEPLGPESRWQLWIARKMGSGAG